MVVSSADVIADIFLRVIKVSFSYSSVLCIKKNRTRDDLHVVFSEMLAMVLKYPSPSTGLEPILISNMTKLKSHDKLFSKFLSMDI